MRALLVVVALIGCVHSTRLAVPAYKGMGPVHRTIATTSPAAQAHFDAGLAATWGFNYDEALYEFLAAIHADPECAMCAWGMAYVTGPNINAADQQWSGSFEFAERAVNLAKTPIEKALAHAIRARVSPKMMVAGKDRYPIHVAYLAAMREVETLAPDDPDVHALLADAMLLSTPPNTPNYNRDRTPAFPVMDEARLMLAKALTAHPDHIGLIHFYIHVLDGSRYMEDGVPYAKKLATLAPMSGHLLHMPSHLYLKLGWYAEADAVNRAAIAADKIWVERFPGGNYAMFTMHPEDYLWYVLLWEGNRKDAESLSRELDEKMGNMPMNPDAGDMRIHLPGAIVRFGLWDLAASLPDPAGPQTTIMVSFARGLADAAKGKLSEAEAELEKLRHVQIDPPAPPAPAPAPDPGKPEPHDLQQHPADAMHGMHGQHDMTPDHPAADANAAGTEKPPAPPAPMPGMGPDPEQLKKRHEYLQAVSDLFASQLAGAILLARGKTDDALTELKHAAELDDKVPDRGETSSPLMPGRHRYGAALLAAGKPAEAAEVYRADLAKHPHNGWALFGLAKALEAQHDPGAAAAMKEFQAAWKNADVKLTSSVF